MKVTTIGSPVIREAYLLLARFEKREIIDESHNNKNRVNCRLALMGEANVRKDYLHRWNFLDPAQGKSFYYLNTLI